MTIQVAKLSDPAVRAFVTAVNAHDLDAFQALLAPGATMSDDGSDRDLADWTDREIFSSHGHMDVDNESNGGRSLIAHYSNDTWGEMKTKWSFTVDDGGKISRFETGQA
ncbi:MULTISPECIES: nuclear transport factor 2 family protein [unclassified Streptomyces]|uniref:nuclear transport factor 2 family protein n=1 Tax=unclassified Streptomyces TaxID=2593676 RepID=UPI00225BBAC4|nr:MULTISPECIES: nuclear transport factor 2 family protein [unclassified Streptomyces]MCX4975037.1 nuclear transport factor 2 family protein [Streptomyces sp. NBC_00620]WUC10775.1 nuclear transport factor 2 family protein [Streptomyces sp. NBC_00564]WUC52710.1 nuclear transport factor 2 family protein [Streptomyces sp. NBC_00554]